MEEIFSMNNTEDISPTDKRRKENKEEVRTESKSVDEAIDTVKKLTGILEILCKKHKVTPNDIKENARQLARAVRTLKRTEGLRKKAELERRNSLEELKDKIPELEQQEILDGMNGHEEKDTQKRNREDIMCKRCKEKTDKERLQEIEDKRIEEEIEMELATVKTEEDFKRVARKKWPKQVFKRVKIIEENITNIKDTGAIIIEKNLEKDRRMLKQLDAHVSGTKEAEKLTAGSVALIKSRSSFNLMTGQAEGEVTPEKAKINIVIGVINKEETEEGLTKVIKKVVKTLKEERGQETPIVKITEQADTENTRKLLEVYGRYFGCDISICRDQKENTQKHNMEKREHKKSIIQGRSNEETTTIRIRAGENRSYSEVLTGVRAKIGPTKIESKIGVSQGVGGDVILKIQGSTKDEAIKIANILKKEEGMKME
ncbi:DNA ligase 1-like, partial [Varroa jacobsoni]|uniref:DNA ligase 1-like n=1 Tax=Varroa jacobsoni TaxID=62625 RepID=UPI000BF7CA8E